MNPEFGQVRVMDNYLERADFEALRAALTAPGFPWERTRILSPSAAAHLAPEDNVQLVHGFYLHKPGVFHQSPQLPLLRTLLARLAPATLLKIKANRTARRARHIEYGLHVDTRRSGATTAIFHLTTNNGYTLFGDGSRVASVENRLVVFDAATLHTGACCTDAPERLVLNLNVMMGPA